MKIDKSRPGFVLTCLFTAIYFIQFSCSKPSNGFNTDIQLNSSWQFQKIGTAQWYTANVPGSLITDLWKNKKISIFSEDQIQLITRETWEYKINFPVDRNILNHDVIDLCFDGLPKNAFVYLNDSLILKSDSWFNKWKINCKNLLKTKENKLSIILKPQHNKALNHKDSLKKYAYPVLGIPKPVYLKAWSEASIKDVFMHPVLVSSKLAKYTSDITIESLIESNGELELTLNNKIISGSQVRLKKGINHLKLNFDIDRPKLWWPNGIGEPNLYQVKIRLKNNSEVIHEKALTLGVRNIEAVSTGSSTFYFKVNGVPVFLKGAGYTPSSLLNCPTVENYRKTLSSALDGNFNVLRLPYQTLCENEALYNLCDSSGLLVWQDIDIPDHLLPLKNTHHIQKNLSAIIHNLRGHASMCAWWSETTRQNDTFTKTFVDLSKEFSPHIPFKYKLNKNLVFPGLDLYNGQMSGNIVTGYGIPVLGSTKLPPDSFIFVGSVEDLYNDIKAAMLDQKLSDYISKNYPKPIALNFESEVYLTRISQAAIMKSLIENHRKNMPICMGSVYEKMNDQRPGISASTVSFSGYWNPSHYAVKNAFSHILVTAHSENNLVNIYAISDALKEVDAFLLVRLIRFTGEDLFVKQMPIKISPNTSSVLLSIKETELLKGFDRRQCCLVVQINQANKTLSQNILYFTEPKNLTLTKPVIETNINQTNKGFTIILKSPVLVKNVYLETISKTAWFTDNNFDLLPGKRTRINVRYSGTQGELLKDLKIMSLIDLKK